MAKKRQKKRVLSLNDLIGATDVLVMFGIVESTFRAACASGRIPAKKVGRDWVAFAPDCEQIWPRLDYPNERNY